MDEVNVTEVKTQLKYFTDLLDDGFECVKLAVEGKTTYFIVNEDGIPLMDLGIFKHE